jgi:hypothetical protein
MQHPTILLVVMVSDHNNSVEEERIKTLRGDKRFHFPSCYQEVVQASTQNTKREPILGDPSFRVMKMHYTFVERKIFVHLDNTPHRGRRLTARRHV